MSGAHPARNGDVEALLGLKELESVAHHVRDVEALHAREVVVPQNVHAAIDDVRGQPIEAVDEDSRMCLRGGSEIVFDAGVYL